MINKKLTKEYPHINWDKYLMTLVISEDPFSSFYMTPLDLDGMDFEIFYMKEMLKNFRLKIENKIYLFN